MLNHKLYLTQFDWDGDDYEGPIIVAKTRAEAELICEDLGCEIVSELTGVIVAEDNHNTLH
tara:strand:+ start:5502 stop:5684 length:183 start_codon:yes stop_codon:yes gene_type:complete